MRLSDVLSSLDDGDVDLSWAPDLRRTKTQEYMRKRKYGLSVDSYQAMLESQNHVCKICHKSSRGGKALSVDHCHDTGRVRGLLCTKCNTGLGQFCDDPVLIKRALEYLLG
jgi:hypothetical protein